jgi:hypothetical protein
LWRRRWWLLLLLRLLLLRLLRLRLLRLLIAGWPLTTEPLAFAFTEHIARRAFGLIHLLIVATLLFFGGCGRPGIAALAMAVSTAFRAAIEATIDASGYWPLRRT